MTRPLIIAPSILSADFGRIAEESAAIAEAGGDWLHLDVMDGSFVPNISFGPAVVAAVRKVTDKPLDVHLMISDPDTYIAAFAEAGANRMTVHVEAVRHLNRTLAAIDAPAGAEPADSYRYDPMNPVQTIGGGDCCNGGVVVPGAFDQRPVEVRQDVLVYTSDVLKQPLSVAGFIDAVLHVASDAKDTDFAVKLVDVDADGTA